MSYANLNGVRDLQVLLKEAALYEGGIDGKWGNNSRAGVQRLLQSYNQRKTGNSLPVIPSTKLPGDTLTQVIVEVQDLLKSAGLYPIKVDGAFGKGTRNGFKEAVDDYTRSMVLPVFGLCWSTKVGKEFTEKVRAGCIARGWPEEAPHWLMAAIHFETGGTFSPTIQNNAGAKYFGLIQFGDDAAEDLGTTTAELRKLSQLDQLDWVFKYFDMWAKRGKKITQLEDMYLTIFYPAAVGKKADTVIFRKDVEATGYRQNNGFDYNKDGAITVGEINSRLYDVYYQGMDTKNRVLH